MTIKIKIAEDERLLSEVDEQWINQQIHRRRATGQTVCVRVTIDEGLLNMILSTPNCGSGGGSRRPPRPQEKEIFDLWNQRGLDQPDFSGGNLVAFLKQMERFF